MTSTRDSKNNKSKGSGDIQNPKFHLRVQDNAIANGNNNNIFGANARVNKRTTNFNFKGIGGVLLGLALLGGGTGVAITQLSPPDAKLADAVGTWEIKQGGGTVDAPTKLVVTEASQFHLSATMTVTMPDIGQTPPVRNAPSLPSSLSQSLDCQGNVSVEGDHFKLRSAQGSCDVLTARVVDNGRAIEVEGEGNEGALSLPKVG